MVDFGTDLSALPDLSFGVKSGRANLAEALARRLMTPRGGLFYDPTYGTDLRSYLNEAITDDVIYEIETLAAAECEQDERVLAATASVIEADPSVRKIRLSINLETDVGPFRLILSIDDVAVEVLRADA